MANEENLIPFGQRSKSEEREMQSRGGKKSGETRRRKANFRNTLNLLLTANIDSPEWTPMLESLGLDSTLESVINAAMIKEAMGGNVKAFEVIAKYSGQTDKTDSDIEKQAAETELLNAKIVKEKQHDGEDEENQVADMLRGILDDVDE